MNSEEIEEEFNMKQVEIPQISESDLSKDMNKKVQVWRVGLALFLLAAGIFLFAEFLPVKFLSSEMVLDNYLDKCCTELYGQSLCSASSNCESDLIRWMEMKNIDVVKNCCYWYAPYDPEKIGTSLYCYRDCLKIY